MSDEDFTQALEDSREIELTVTGRTSGREISNPVWFVQDGETLYLVPVKGSDSDWYKNILKTPTVVWPCSHTAGTHDALPPTARRCSARERQLAVSAPCRPEDQRGRRLDGLLQSLAERHSGG